VTGEEERIDRVAWAILARRAEQPTYSYELTRTIAAQPGDGPAVDARLAEIVKQIRAGARLDVERAHLAEVQGAIHRIHYPHGDPATEGNVWCACDKLWPCETVLATSAAVREFPS